MRRVAATAAAAAFAAYFLAWSFGYLDMDWPGSGLSREAFYGLTVVLPCLLVGAAIGRAWALLLPLVFVAAVPLPDVCSVDATGSDYVMIGCHGIAVDDLPLRFAITLPFLLAGVAARRLSALAAIAAATRRTT